MVTETSRSSTIRRWAKAVPTETEGEGGVAGGVFGTEVHWSATYLAVIPITLRSIRAAPWVVIMSTANICPRRNNPPTVGAQAVDRDRVTLTLKLVAYAKVELPGPGLLPSRRASRCA